MTSFDTSPLNVWRAVLALAVVFVMLATTGWTAVSGNRDTSELRASVSAWEHGRLHGHRLPDPDAAPARLARFFASLTAADRVRLARRFPLAVGNMNGAPVSLRYRANRIALGRAHDAEEKRMHDSRLTPAGQREAGLRMHRFASLASGGRQILSFDPDGSGRVAEVFGDLDEAQRVSVVVPGVDTDLLTFQRSVGEYTAPSGMASALYSAERSARPSTRTAVIAWADWTAPSGLGVDAATGSLAAQGALRLNALVRALPGTAPVSLFCHSYGSVLCGVAAHLLPGRVADIAVAGSPGMRADDSEDLGTGARVWAMRDGTDWIRDVPYLELGGLGHGADPVDPEFGARVLSAAGAKGHTGYFTPGTTSLANFADIGTGSYTSVRCARSDAECGTGLSAATAGGRA